MSIYTRVMSKMNPTKAEYESHDGLSIAKDIAWVIKTLWGGAVVFVLATVWVVALAQDVKSNTENLEEAATQEQMAQVLEGIKDIKKSLNEADDRQREIKSQVDKLEAKVDSIEKRDE